ncbi:MAG: DUF3144 domain-containing protein [Lysobacterales bacterium]
MTSQEKQHQECTNRFIELANEMKKEGIEPGLVSGSLMTASGVYATYVAAGNDGTLEPTGVKKVVDLYQNTLERYQHIKKNQLMKKKFA